MASELWQMLPPDMTVWNTAVMETLVRKVPEAGNYVSGISWSSLDPSTGNGDGLIAMLNGLASAPITIRGNKLAPIDLMVTRSGNEVKFYPLSDLFLRKVYADNVIGEPVANQPDSEESYEGPARRIQNINTVNAVKYASVEAAKNLFEEITKSASVANWVAEKMPETFLAVYNRANEVESVKEASAELPELIVVQKEGNEFYINNELATSEDVGAVLKFASATPVQRTALMEGKPFLFDARQKIATIHIPTEQDIIESDLEDEIFNGGVDEDKYKPHDTDVPDLALSTVYTRSGEQIRGIIFSKHLIHSTHIQDCQRRGVPPIPNAFDPSVDFAGSELSYNKPTVYGDSFDSRELFVSDKGYAIQESIKSSVRTPISMEMLLEMSEPSKPAIGMVGLFIKTKYDEGDMFFGRIDDYVSIGAHYKAKIYDLVSHNPAIVSMIEYEFYEVNPERLSVMRNTDVADVVSMTGIIGRVVRDNEGNYIIDDKKVSAINCPYALMHKYAASYEDAIKIASIAEAGGSCVFEVKLAADNDNADKTKNRKGTKSGTDDEGAEVQPQNPSSPALAQQTPETAMSTDMNGSNPAEPNFFGTQAPQTLQTLGQPVTSKDLENVVQLNDSQVMDAYMMSNLAATDTTSQDTLMKASDSIVDALSKLSQILFLVRQGSLSYISENDVQVAMNKLTDVAQSLGIDPMRVGTM